MPTRELSVRLPADLDADLQDLAQYLGRDRSSLVTRALESFVAKWKQQRDELEAPIDAANPSSMSLGEVSTLVMDSRGKDRESKAA